MIPELRLDRLRPGSQRHYERVFRWLCENFSGSWSRTEPLQAFLDGHDDPAVRHGTRGRIVQSLVNRHVDPRPEGPPLVLRPPGRGSKRPPPRPAPGDKAAPDAGWTSYLPVWMQPELGRCPEAWRVWLAHYVLRVLRANALRRNIIRTYVTHVVHVLLWQLQCRSLDGFLALRREDLAQAVVDANAGHVHQQRLCRIAVNHFVGGVVFRDHRALVERLHLRTRDLPHTGRPIDGATRARPYDNVDVAPCARSRDHFTEAEMQALLALPQLTPRDRLMLRVMAETGLRRRAVSWLLVDAVYDRNRGAPLTVGSATEKGLAVRRFTLSAGTRAQLDDYVRNHHPGPATRWLFPSPHHGARAPISAGVVSQVLARACRSAGIRGRHIHTHAIRKGTGRPVTVPSRTDHRTVRPGVVCRLMRANNRTGVPSHAHAHTHTHVCTHKKKPPNRAVCGRIENVAKWLGHKTVNLTYATYWDVDGLDVAGGMNIPWLEDSASA